MSPSGPERRLQRLEWTVLRRLDGLLQGDYRKPFHRALSLGWMILGADNVSV